MSKKIYQVLLLVFCLSWGLVGIAKLSGMDYLGSNGLFLAIAFMFMPALSVFILSKFIWKEKLNQWGIARPKGRIFFIAWFWAIVLAFGTIPISLLIPGVTFSSEMEGFISQYSTLFSAEKISEMKSQISAIGPFMPLIFIIQSLIAGITINAIAAFGEEYLWRGFLLKELKKFGWLRSSLIIGFIWGIWHAPLIIQGHNYPSHPEIGVLMMIIWCILLTPALIYFTVRTKSVFTAAVMHGTLNASAAIPLVWIVGGNDLTVGSTGFAGFITLLILNIILIIYNSKSKIKADDLLSQY
ncbi:CPBP family intramembrane metalloprotease [bacterium]|nr:CPBP family intramembrane metalloprotease [bacterium]